MLLTTLICTFCDPQVLYYDNSIVHIHHHHLFLILSPKADIYYTQHQKMEG